MINKNYRPRIIDKMVENYLETFGAVCIEGPKWCGKTWTSSFHSKSEIYIGDPSGEFQNRKLAKLSPELVLQGKTPRLIDEWQEVPLLWDAVRYEVDRRNDVGQFILTGSATPNHKGILHSGAGRIGKIRMRPMSLFETGVSSGDISLKDLCNNSFAPKMTGEVKLGTLADNIVRGGWPSNQEKPIEKAALIPREYIEAIVNEDVYKVDGIKRNKNKMMLLLRSLARNESTTVTNKSLARDIKEIDEETINKESIVEYLDIFERLFLTDNQLPFSVGARSSKRVKHSVKRHFSDPSLACAILKMMPESLINDLRTMGFLFEALVERDLKIYAESFGAELYHYQDYDGKEIDAVIELADGEWCGFEIKLGPDQVDKAAKSLLKINESFKKNGQQAKALCVICGLSNAAYQREDGVYVVPITALRD